VRRILRLALYLVAVLPLGSLVLMALAAYRAFARVQKADPEWKPAFRVLAWARAWCLLYRVPWDFALSILHNEQASTPRTILPRESRLFPEGAPAEIYPLGDVSIFKGPSVGPGQVLRVNVETLWEQVKPPLRAAVVAGSYLDLARVGFERQSTWAAVRIMRESLDAAGPRPGDETGGADLNEAARIYNGGRNYNSNAVAYANAADTFRGKLA